MMRSRGKTLKSVPRRPSGTGRCAFLNRLKVLLPLLGGMIVLCSCAFPAEQALDRHVKIPEAGAWKDAGTALSQGPPGAWDARLTGMISPCALVKKNGVYFLYYLGANGDRTTDGGPAFRALGVATSRNGLRFTKFDGNPILTHTPHNNQEEGIFSAGAALDEKGRIVLHYGALWAADHKTETVRSNIAMAVSADGLAFTDKGYILRWDDSRVWGYGDELFPVGTLQAEGRWFVYYVAKGIAAPRWSVGLASGPAPDHLPDTQPVIARRNYYRSGANPVRLSTREIALFIHPLEPRDRIEIRTASISNPAQVSAPHNTYDLAPGVISPIVYFDREAGRWFMFHISSDGAAIRVRTAEATIDLDGAPSRKTP